MLQQALLTAALRFGLPTAYPRVAAHWRERQAGMSPSGEQQLMHV